MPVLSENEYNELHAILDAAYVYRKREFVSRTVSPAALSGSETAGMVTWTGLQGMAPEQVSKVPISGTTTQALENLIITYHELNSSAVDELASEPSPLEFMRYAARNRPFVVRGGAAHWYATQRWNAEYLRSVMGSSKVNVAVTPAGFVGRPLSTFQADGMPAMQIPWWSIRGMEVLTL